MRTHFMLLTAVSLGWGSAAQSAPVYVSCNFAPKGEVAAYRIDPSTKRVTDSGSPSSPLRVVSFTDGQIIVESDNPFYGFTFVLSDGMTTLSRLTINRVTGAAYANLSRSAASYHSSLCPKDSTWTCVSSSQSVNEASGICVPVRRRF